MPSIRNRIESICARGGSGPRANAHSAPNSKSSREQMLSIRFRVESTCSRFEVKSNESARDSASGRQHLRAILLGVESTRFRLDRFGGKCSRFETDSSAVALDSAPSRQHLPSNQIRFESTCSHNNFKSRAHALDSIARREHPLCMYSCAGATPFRRKGAQSLDQWRAGAPPKQILAFRIVFFHTDHVAITTKCRC